MIGGINLVFLVLIFILHGSDLCSPPRSKFGEHSFKEQSLIKRSDKADIVVLGSVVETYPDKYSRSLTIRVAVHMVLKSATRIMKYIKISGFDVHSKSKKHKFFNSQASLDCVNTVVELYGSYIFFIRKDQYGDFYVHEINYQSAVTEIPCKEQLSKRVKRLIIKYRKVRKNRAQCNDFALSKSSFSRKCLKHRSFSRLLNEFKYKMLPIRKFFCSVRRSSTKIKTKGKSEPTMRDDVRPRRPNNKNKNAGNSKDNSFLKTSNNINNNKNNGPKIILYSKSENYILRDDVTLTTSKQSPVNNRVMEIPDWRFFQQHYHSHETSSASNYMSSHFLVAVIVVLISLTYTYL